MTRTKIDNRIRILIENGIKLNHRSMFVVVGDKGRDQVMILHHILSKGSVKTRPSVLWCYKKDLGFTTHRRKRMKNVQKKIKSGKFNINEDDPFELFIASTNIRYCYYSETQKILGQTFGVCVLQDFEAITPNLLARTIETVEGGGLVILLLRTLTSLKQLYSMAMDVHERYRTEAHQDIVGRFNERFLLSLSSCQRCLVVDDKLNILPISSHIYDISALPETVNISESKNELTSLQEELRDTQPVSSLINCCKTLDQAKAVLKFIDAISDKSLKFTISLTAARGRGKSAAMGLAVAGAIAFGYTNIFVTSPSPDNLKTFFEFVFKGFDVLGYQEHLDYGLVQSLNSEYNKALIRVNVFKTNRQTIQYISPTDAVKLSHAELLVIDEAAAIPLPYVKEMFGPYLIFLSSTINGYEGTGRSLSLKLLQELRNQSSHIKGPDGNKSLTGRTLHEITLEESIRYNPNDSVEQWLTEILCLNACNVEKSWGGIPPPNECELYYINRDTLFCYHKASETFLQRIMALYVSSHYKNSPNDLQLMSDAPAHHLFCLLGPVDSKQTSLPEVFCVIQVCLEGQLSQKSVGEAMSQGRKPTGDLIPWTVAQQFQDKDFPSLSGLRIVRIATHPDYQSMGYGSRALSLLKSYYEMQFPITDDTNVSVHRDFQESDDVDLLEETIEPRSDLPPLLLKLNERTPEKLDYIGVSYGMTLPLLKFWKSSGFVPVYLRQTPNDLTAEHSCIMLKVMENTESDPSWLTQYWLDFKRRFVSLLSFQFRSFPTSLGLSVLFNENNISQKHNLTKTELDVHLTKYDLKRLELYCNNLADYHLIMDLLPTIARLFVLDQLGHMKCTAAQSAILLGIGLQHKTVDELSKELELPPTQLLGLFNRSMRKIRQYLQQILEDEIEKNLGLDKLNDTVLETDGVTQSLSEELDSADKALKKKHNKQKKKDEKSLFETKYKPYVIENKQEAWDKALEENADINIVSVKRENPQNNLQDMHQPLKKMKKGHKNSHNKF